MKIFPTDSFDAVPLDVKQALSSIASSSPLDLMKYRIAQVAKVKSIVEECKNEQLSETAMMEPEVANIMAPIQTVAIKKLSKMMGIVDHYFHHGLTHGFALCGDIPATGRWEPMKCEAEYSVAEWSRRAPSLRSMVLGRTVSSGDERMDALSWRATLDEVDRGWLHGPMEIDEAIGMMGAGMVPARPRFMVIQKDKARPVDDYTVSGANGTIGVADKPFLEPLDVLISRVRLLQRELVATQGVDHAGVKGRTIDLESAFRQLATDPSMAYASCVAVYSPEAVGPKIFVQRALPFGSKTSVYAFARLSEFIRCMLVRQLMIVSAAFVDDFSLVDGCISCGSCSFAAEECLRLLGVRYSVKAAKRRPFSEGCKLLGVWLRLTV
eukprot:1559036-Amphidinium_carterae.1